MSKKSQNALKNNQEDNRQEHVFCFEKLCDIQETFLSNHRERIKLDKKSKNKDNLENYITLNEGKNKVYDCKKCNYYTKKKTDMEKHLKTKKHNINNEIKGMKGTTYKCKKCNKGFEKYKTYWAHGKKCDREQLSIKDDNVTVKDIFDNINNDIITHNDNTDKYGDIISKLMVEMRQFMKETITEIAKTSSVTNNINGNVQTNNNKFNINVFLNEKCKDAMNLSDFLDSIVVTREDLENNAKLGFVNGMTKIIMDNMKRLDILERSMHCTDFKRETMYIKDNDKWTKEENNDKLNSAIQKISNKSIKTLAEWREEHPDRTNYDSDFYKNCNIIMQNSMASSNRQTYYPKIIKNIARETTIDKNNLVTS
jgi:hypothetical protein